MNPHKSSVSAFVHVDEALWVGTDRWVVREYPYGAPSGHALPTTVA